MQFKVSCSLLLMGGLAIATANADELCANPKEKAAAQTQLAKAQALQSAGKLEEAYAAAGVAGDDCVNGSAVKQQVAKKLAANAEAKGNFGSAVDWYVKGNSPADADRVIRKWVQIAPLSTSAVGAGIDFYRMQNNAAQEQAMRDLAKRRIDALLADESKLFAAPLKGTYPLLREAKEWAFYANSGEPQINQRAQQRGDAFAKETSRRFLSEAMQYYELGGSKAGVDSVKRRASTLGQQAEGRGEIELAVEYYRLADENSKAETLDKRHEAAQKQAEDKRKQSFKKGQDDLEKELGF